MISHLILASASPRRVELLRQLRCQFTVYPLDLDESRQPNEPPQHLVRRLAQLKAETARDRRGTREWFLGADTVVALGQEILGKPDDAAQATAMLRALSGRVHSVYSGIALAATGVPTEVAVVRTRVRMVTLSEAMITAYVKTGEPLGKAGAYAIQGQAATFISRIAGSYSNVVGLPLFELSRMLERAGEPGNGSVPKNA